MKRFSIHHFLCERASLTFCSFLMSQVDQVVEAWRQLLEGVSAPARLVKRAEEERRFERKREEEEEIKKRKVQEEKKPICSECDKEQSNNRDQHHDVTLASAVNPHLGEMFDTRKINSGEEKQESGVDQAGVVLLTPSSEPSGQEVGTTQTTTEVNF